MDGINLGRLIRKKLEIEWRSPTSRKTDTRQLNFLFDVQRLHNSVMKLTIIATLEYFNQ